MSNKRSAIQVDVQFLANLDKFTAATKNMQSQMSNMNISTGTQRSFDGLADKLNTEVQKIKDITSRGNINIIDANKVDASMKKIESTYIQMINKIRDAGGDTTFLKDDLKALQALKNQQDKVTEATEKTEKTRKRLNDQLEKAVKNQEKLSKKNAVSESDYDNLKKSRSEAKAKLDAANARKAAAEENVQKKIEGSGGKYTSEDSSGFKNTSAYQEKKKAIEEVQQAEQQLIQIEKQLENTTTFSKKAKEANKLQEQVNLAEKELNDFNNAQKKSSNSDAFASLRQSLAEMKGIDWSKYGVDISSITNMDQLRNAILQVSQAATANGVNAFNALESEVREIQQPLDGAKASLQNMTNELSVTDQKMGQVNSLKQRIEYFFGLNNAIMLARRAVTKIFNTVKELDSIMTETAVVTDFSVGDMWERLPEYTDRANQFGLAIKDVYQADTLFYQQGLKTNEVVALSNETMKMARIAGLDTAEATDRMTNALRGFNMELNETNAQNVADVYSKLAAMSASNVDELSVAMTKTASIASNAGASFENTAAFIAQIVETTRESAETAGTALKTVIARFTELKKDPSEIGEVDGEVVDANKIETALRSVGVALRDTNGQFRDFDDVILELSGKWDSLDMNTQRYIATIAAGSRQQSRFIALMSNNDRLMELTSAANDSAGASADQYAKTLESLTTKLNNLSNQWNTFLLNIANNQAIKAVVDLLTSFIEKVNGLTESMPSLIKTILNLLLAIGSFKIGAAFFTSFSAGMAALKATAAKGGADAGAAFSKTFSATMSNQFAKTTTLFKTFKTSILGINKMSVAPNFTKMIASAKQAQAQTKSIATGMKVLSKTELASNAEVAMSREAAATAKQRYNLITKVGQKYEAADLKTKKLVNIANAEGVGIEGLNNILMAKGNKAKLEAAAVEILHAKGIDETTDGYKEQLAAQILALKTGQAEKASKLQQIALLFSSDKATRMAALSKLGLAGADGTATGAQWALNAAIYACPLGWILVIIVAVIAAIALLVVGIIALIKYMKDNTVENRLKRSEARLKSLEEQVSSTKDAIDDLESSWDSLQDASDKLKELTYGSQEWKDSLVEVNSQVLDLVNKYPQLAQYMTSNDGVLGISEEGYNEVLKQQQQMLQGAQATLMVEKKRNAELKLQKKENDIATNLENNTYVVGKNAQGGTTVLNNGSYDDTDRSQTYKKLMSQISSDTTINKEWLKQAIEDTNAFGVGLQGSTVTADSILENTAEEDIELMISEMQAYQRTLTETTQLQDSYNKALGTFLTNSEMQTYTIDGKNYGEALADLAAQNLQISDQELTRLADSGGLASGQSYLGVDTSFQKGTNGNAGIAEYIDAYNERHGASVVKTNSQTQNIINLLSAYTGKSAAELEEEYNGEEDAMADALAAFVAADDAAMRAENMFDQLKALPKEIQKQTLNITSRDGMGITRSTIQNKGLVVDGKVNEDSVNSYLQDLAQKSGKSIEEYAEMLGYQSVDALRTSVIKNITTANKSFDEALKEAEIYGKDGKLKAQVEGRIKQIEQAYGEEFTAELYTQFANIFTNLSMSGGDLEQISGTYAAILEKTTSKNKEQVFSLLETMDLTSSQSIASTIEAIRDLGIELDGDLTQQLIEAANAAADIDLTKLIEQLQSIYQLANDIKSRDDTDRNFSKEELDELIKQGISRDDFVFNGVDYTYVGESMNTLVAAIEENTAAQLSTTKKNLEQDVSKGEIFAGEYSFDFASELDYEGTFAGLVEQYMNGMHKDEGGLDQLLYKLGYTDEDLSDKSFEGKLEMLTADYGKYYGEGGDVFAQNKLDLQDSKQIAEETMYTRAESGQDILDIKAENNDKTKGASKALDARIYSEKGLKEIVESTTRAFEDQGYALDDLVKAHIYDLNEAEKKISNVKTTWSEVGNVIKSGNKNTKQYASAMGRIKNDFQGIFGDYINDSFLEQAGMSDLIETFSEGGEAGEEAWNTITNLALQYYLQISGFSEETKNQILNTIDQINSAPIQADGTIIWSEDMGELTPETREALTKSGYTITTQGQNTVLSKASGSLLSGEDTKEVTYWENSFDRYYNLLEGINSEMRERNKLEREFQRLQDSDATTASQLKDNLKGQVASLNSSIAMNETLRTGREKQVQELMAKNSKFSDLVSYDAERGEVGIDWNKVDQKTGNWTEDQGAEFEEYVNQLKEWADEINDLDDTIEDTKDELDELKDTGKDEYLELEQKVYDAIISREEELIENMQTINDSINDANTELLDGLRTAIADARQARQNEETEKDIADKEQQLAYLSASTTADPLEIMRLEEELADARQDYTDTLIDQKISELEDQNEAAAEQREKQIAIAQAQLQYNKDNGKYWDDVETLLNDEKNILNGQMVQDGPLDKLLKNTSGWASMSAQQRADWSSDINSLTTMADVYKDKSWQQSGLSTEETVKNYLSSNQNAMKDLKDAIANNSKVVADANKERGTVYHKKDGAHDTAREYEYDEKTGTFKRTTTNISAKLTQEGGLEYFDSKKAEVFDEKGQSQGTKVLYQVKDTDGKLKWIVGDSVTTNYEQSTQKQNNDAKQGNNNSGGDKAEAKQGMSGGIPSYYIETAGLNDCEDAWFDLKINGKLDTQVETGAKSKDWSQEYKKTTGSDPYAGAIYYEDTSDGGKLYVNGGTAWYEVVDQGANITTKSEKQSNYELRPAGLLSAAQGVRKTYKDNVGFYQFKTGGLADFTGPAWLDGTKSAPEIVLNAQDTKNFLQLRDILSDVLKGGNFDRESKSSGDNYYDIQINVDEIASDYDVDQLAARIKQQIVNDANYRNVNAVSFMR